MERIGLLRLMWINISTLIEGGTRVLRPTREAAVVHPWTPIPVYPSELELANRTGLDFDQQVREVWELLQPEQ